MVALPDGLFCRQQDRVEGRRFEADVSREMLRRLEFSRDKVIRSAHKGGVTWMDLDPVEHRYLLAGAADASLAAYDTRQPSRPAAPGQGGAGQEHRALFTITKQTPGAHAFSVSSVAWYPVDTGLFVSGGFDRLVKVWDANTLQLACEFTLGARVYAVAMSPAACSHCLIAAGTADVAVTLADVASGGFTHTLSGHRAPVWAVAWSPACEWELATGSCDGQLRLWDIRRAGAALAVFDQHHTGRRATDGPAARPDGGSDPGAGPGHPHRREQRPQEGPPGAYAYASAHGGTITGVEPTPDGLFWLSAGTDDRLRLWDASSRAHALVHYPAAYNRASKGRQLAVSGDGAAVAHPSGSAVQVFDVQRGTPLATLTGGHFESVNCCRWAAGACELYSGAADCSIAVWAPRRGGGAEEGGAASDCDDWSD